MKVLILGINSFTGSHLSRYLIRQGLTVFGTVNQPSPLISQTIFQCDICNPKQVKDIFQQVQPEFVINLAGISFVAHKDISNFYSINALAVENILKACLAFRKQPAKIILASSSVVYGNQNEKNLSAPVIFFPLFAFAC